MKKTRNIGLILGLIILISSNSNAQYFYTSNGYTQNWYLPAHVEYSIQDNYFGYDIAHVRRYANHGYNNYNVLLHRNGFFVELRFDRHGHVNRTIRHNYYPLISHRCTNHCGYHHTYYKTYYPTYHHKHYVHKHRRTVYANTHNQHHSNHNKYYTNVHVEKQQKKQNHYQSNQQQSRQKQNTVNNRNSNQHQRSNSVIRQPQQSNRQTQPNVKSRTNNSQPRSNAVTRKSQQTNRNIGNIRSQGNINSVQHYKPQRSSSNSNKPKSLIAYKNERGRRNR